MNQQTKSLKLILGTLILVAFPTFALAMGSASNSGSPNLTSCQTNMMMLQGSSAGVSQTFTCPASSPNLSYPTCASTGPTTGNPANPSSGATCHMTVFPDAANGANSFQATCYKSGFDVSHSTTCTVQYDCCM